MAAYFAAAYVVIWYSYQYIWTIYSPERNQKHEDTATESSSSHAEAKDTFHVPHPWNLEVSESYIFPLDASKIDSRKLEPHLTSAEDKRDFLESGLGAVMLVRYADSPVGPYDELLLIPGAFRTKGCPCTIPSLLCDRRVTHIFVSTMASVRNGRRNWGIRKELAQFEWQDKTYFSRRVTISLVGGSSRYNLGESKQQKRPVIVFEASFYRSPCFFPASTVPIPRFIMPSIVEKAIDEGGNVVLCPEKQTPFWLATKLDITSGIFGLCSGLVLHSVDEEHFPNLDKLGGMLGVGLCGWGSMKFCSPVKLEDDNFCRSCDGINT